MDLSLVIPCYNSSKTVELVLNEFWAAMSTRPEIEYEIILVNDHSPDNTWDTIKEIAKKHPEITCVNFSKNFGQPSALLAGFSLTRGEYIFTSDDDGQCPVGEVFRFWEELDKGYDVVCAKYETRNQSSVTRRMGTRVNEWMTKVILKKPDGVSLASFFMAKRFVIDAMLAYKNPYPYIAGLLLRTTFNIGNVTLEQRKRAAGHSGYNYKKLLKLWVNGFTAFSVIPLRIASFLGLICSGIGLITTVVVIVNKLLNPAVVAGWSSLLAVTLILGGLILLVLGMIGEYVGRIYLCINHSPQYVIREIYTQNT